MLTTFNELKQVSAVGILHDQQEVFGTLEDFKQADNVRVSDLLEDVYLLHNFLFGIRVLHVALIYRFYGYLAPCELVDSKCDLTKSSLSYRLD